MRKMKDSGVEWIDTIPENWKVVPMKALFSFGKGLVVNKQNLKALSDTLKAARQLLKK